MKLTATLLLAWVVVLIQWGDAVAVESRMRIRIARQKPCNLFPVEEDVRFAATVHCKTAETGVIAVEAVDFNGRIAVSKKIPFDLNADSTSTVSIDLGRLAPGYYELHVRAISDPPHERTNDTDQTICFAVAQLMERSAVAARREHSRFGMKLWLIGDIWWNRSLRWDPREVIDGCAALGLQWTRALINQEHYFDTRELMREHPVNVISKIECFSESCFDTERYGPLEEFRKTQQGRAWNKCSLPREGPYKSWLAEQLRTIPPDQNVFEVWNEAWQWFRTMPAEDFAVLSRWTAQAVHAERPGAIVGPNIHGDLTSYDLAFIAAGGLEDADMVAIHPYTAGTPESKGFRQHLRNYHDMLQKTLGRDLDLYATEFGWSTAPQGDRSVDEAEQARRTVRESLILYAEGVKTLIPHTMGQREQDPKEREHWFGFFRLAQEPKPALVAFAQCARMIDSSCFVGDLWLGPGVGAMLFERNDVHTLALWTEGDAKQVTVDVAAEKVTLVDMMGRAKPLTTSGGRLSLEVNGNVIYLVGVGSVLAQSAAGPSQPLRSARWSTRGETHTVPRLTKPVVVDGHLDEWQQVPVSTLTATNLDDIAAEWRLGWDDDCLYLAVRVKDKRLVNDNAMERISMADVVDFQVCSRPDRQVSRPSLYDHRLLIAPTSATGEPVCILENVLSGKVVIPHQEGRANIRWAVDREANYWNVEAAIPFAQLDGAEAEIGSVLSFLLVAFDRDRTDVDEWRQWHKRVQTFNKKAPARERPLLVLGE